MLKQKIACLFLVFFPVLLQAETYWYDYDHLNFQIGTYIHYKDSKDYKGNKIFVSFEVVKKNKWLLGSSLFDNSFGDFSQYFYFGKSWNLPGKSDGFHLKATAGLIHGYEKKRNVSPVRIGAFDGAIIPGVGYKKNGYGIELIILRMDSLLVTVNADF